MRETIEDLQCKGMKLVQDKDGFRFGTDAVLLSDFARNFGAKTALDLCSGNGIIPILMSAKTKTEKIYGIEIQRASAELFKKSIALNGLEERVEVICDDLKNLLKIFPKRSFDMITCNPPYMKCGAGVVNETDTKTIARHEILCTLEDCIAISSLLLAPKGRLFMVHRPSRLAEVISLFKKHKIEPKRLRLVYPDEKSEPTLFLIEGLIFGGEEMRIMPPLFLKNAAGEESEELKAIYNREN